MTMSRTIVLPERFDFDSHQEFSGQCENLMQDGAVKQLVLDFSLVRYVDSAALGMLVLLYRKCTPAGIKLSIQGARGTALDILNVANMRKLYSIE